MARRRALVLAGAACSLVVVDCTLPVQPAAPPAPLLALPADQLWDRRQSLFDGYDAALPPPNMRHGNPLLVKFGLVVKKVEFDIHSSTLHLDVWLRMKWLDERLLYNPAAMFGPDWEEHDYVPIAMMTGDDTNLWVPDVHCVNATNSIDGLLKSHAYIHHEASAGLNDTVPWNVFLSRPGCMSVHCSPQLENFPFDTPSCQMDFQSWGFSDEYVRIVNMTEGWQVGKDMPLSMDYKFADDGAFTWKEDAIETAADFQSCGQSWSNYRVTMNLRRLPSYHITHSVAPLSMVVFLASLTFWLPLNNDSSGSGERLSYTVMLVLTIITVMLFTAGKKPAVPETTWMDKWQTRSLLLSVLPVIETAVIFWFQNLLQLQEAEEDEPMTFGKAKSIAKQDKTKALNKGVADVLHGVIDGLHRWMPPGLLRFMGPVGPENIDTWFRILFPVIILFTYEALPMRIFSIVAEHGVVHGTQLFMLIVLFLVLMMIPSLYLLCSRILYACSEDCCRCGHNPQDELLPSGSDVESELGPY